LASGGFDTLGQLHANLIENTLARLPKEEVTQSKGGLGLFCLPINDPFKEDEGVHVKEIVKQAKALEGLGYGAMICARPELYRMSAYANRYTKSPIHFAIWLAAVVRVLEHRYNDLPGALLEGIGRLFTQNVRLIVYPMAEEELRGRLKTAGLSGWSWKQTNGMVSAENLAPSGPLGSLYQYLLRSGFILPGKPGGAKFRVYERLNRKTNHRLS